MDENQVVVEQRIAEFEIDVATKAMVRRSEAGASSNRRTISGLWMDSA